MQTCKICHKSDLFDQNSEHCARCGEFPAGQTPASHPSSSVLNLVIYSKAVIATLTELMIGLFLFMPIMVIFANATIDAIELQNFIKGSFLQFGLHSDLIKDVLFPAKLFGIFYTIFSLCVGCSLFEGDLKKMVGNAINLFVRSINVVLGGIIFNYFVFGKPILEMIFVLFTLAIIAQRAYILFNRFLYRFKCLAGQL